MDMKFSRYARKKMDKYEYMRVKELLPISVETLDEMNKGGWELVAITTFTNNEGKKYISYFKRVSFK